MMRSLWTAASGMRSQQTNVDNISNNLANVNSVGYKKNTAEFKSLLYQNLQSTSTNNAGENKPVAAQVGLGSRLASITSVYTQGPLTANESPLAVAVQGDGFFKVRDKNGDTLYTRDGSFQSSPVNGGNMICTSDGNPLLDVNNKEIIIPSDYTLSTLVIDEDGNMSAKNAEGELVNLGVKIGLVQFNNPAGLAQEGNNLLRVTNASGNPMEESTSANLTKSKINQYYIEGSNVQVVDEMVNLIVAQRAYEINSKAITASDEMLKQANNLRG